MELGQEALLLLHLCLDGPGAVRQLGDVLHRGNVPGQLHPTEQSAVVLENAVLDSDEREKHFISAVKQVYSHLCDIFIVGDNTMEIFCSVMSRLATTAGS